MLLKLWGLLPAWGKGAAVAGAAALVALTLWRVYDAGYDAASSAWEQRLADARADAVDDYHEARQADRALRERWWEADRDREVEVRVVERERIRYVRENPDAAGRRCLDERLLELWNGIQRRSLLPGDPAAGDADEGVPGGDAGPRDG